MIALVEDLLKAQADAIGKLESRIKVLEDQASKDSQNSSKPPSGDGFKKRPQSLRSQSGRKSGGQTGHPGSTLEWVDEPDEIEQQVIEVCQGCGASLVEMPIVKWQCAQVHDLVPIEMRVKEHQVAVKQCACCGQRNQAAFPVGVSNRVQYGSGLRSLIVYLMDYPLLPSARVQELLSEVLGCSLSEGTLYQTRQTCFELLGEVEVGIFESLQQAEVAHFDETGLPVNGKLMWLHVVSTQALTYYFIHPKRGSEAMEAMDILPQFKGTSVHDGWRSYALYGCVHALCNAHHWRELRDGQVLASQSHIDLAQVSSDLATRRRGSYTLRDRLQSYPISCDLLVLDCPATLGMLCENALAASDLVLVLVQLEPKSIGGAADLVAWCINASNELQLEPRPKIQGIVPSIYNKDAAIHRQYLEQLPEIAAQLDIQVYPPIRYSKEFVNTSAYGLPLHKYRPGHPACDDFEAITQDLVTLLKKTHAQKVS